MDATTSFSSFLRRGICCLKLLGLGSVCRTSISCAHENVHEEQIIKLTSLVHSSCDAASTGNKYDEESLDSGLQISQELTLDSGSDFMVANPRRGLTVIPAQVAVTTTPLLVRETIPSTDSETGNFVEEKNSETYKKSQAFTIKADVLWEIEKHAKSSEHEYRGEKPNTKHLNDDCAVDSINEAKIPADKCKDYMSSNFEGNSMSGCNSEAATEKDSKEDFKSNCSDRQCLSVEDLFTRRKLSTEDDELLTSRQIDDIIQVRCDAPAPPDIDDEEATVAKQPVATAATGDNRLVLLDNFI